MIAWQGGEHGWPTPAGVVCSRQQAAAAAGPAHEGAPRAAQQASPRSSGLLLTKWARRAPKKGLLRDCRACIVIRF